MASEIVEYRQQSVEDRFEFARRLAAAGDMLPAGLMGQVQNPQTGAMERRIVPGKVFLITETARMLGIDPMAGLQGINVIEGSASIAPSLMQALVRRAGHQLRVRTTGTLAAGTLKATATLIRKDDPEPFVVEWTPHDAVQADLADSYEPDENGVWQFRARSRDGNKLAWEKYTRQLCKWRAQSEVVRDGAEEVLLGVHYTPEELGAVFAEDGRMEPATVAEYTDTVSDIVSLIESATTKAELDAIWDAWHEADAWLGKVEATYYAKVGSLNVEDADVVDEDSDTAEAQQGHQDDETAGTTDGPSETPDASTGRTAPRFEPSDGLTEDEYEALARAEADAALGNEQ